MNKHNNNKNNNKIPFSDGSQQGMLCCVGHCSTWSLNRPTATVCEAVGGDEHVPFSQGQWASGILLS